jgi:hypothetical protein
VPDEIHTEFACCRAYPDRVILYPSIRDGNNEPGE